jgi:hypothetical protein
VVEGASAQHVLRRQRQRVDPVPVPLERPHQLALLRAARPQVAVPPSALAATLSWVVRAGESSTAIYGLLELTTLKTVSQQAKDRMEALLRQRSSEHHVGLACESHTLMVVSFDAE